VRSTVDPIKELETEGARHFICILAVGSESPSVMISAKQEDRLQLLNDSIGQGGIPVGLITADNEAEGPEGGVLNLTAQIFPEHLENGPNEQAETFMLTLVDKLKKIAEHEIHGTQLNGGEAQNLVPGDVIIVPAGVPHWFKEVQAPFLHYTVKVQFKGKS